MCFDVSSDYSTPLSVFVFDQSDSCMCPLFHICPCRYLLNTAGMRYEVNMQG